MHELIELAKSVIKSELTNSELKIPLNPKTYYSQNLGIFIKLKKGGIERGTFGFTETPLPLWKSLPQAVKAAAFNDPQFPPVNLNELKDIGIEIYLLSQPLEFHQHNFDINDALMIIGFQGESILLPGIAKDKIEAIELLYKKSGLPKNDSNKFYKFKVEIIKEK